MADKKPDERVTGELLEALSDRRLAGERTVDRLGGRRWGTVGGARRERLFERIGLNNPWDPDAPEELPVSLGPVALKLTERRQPAPHASPPSRSGAEKQQGQLKPGGPDRPSRPAPAKKAASKTGQKTGEKPPPAASPAELAAMAAKAVAPKGAAPAAEEELDRTPPGMPAPARRKSARVRLGARTVARAPIYKPAEPPPEEAGAEGADAAAAPAGEKVGEKIEEKVERTPPRPGPPPGADMGLDDLFGFNEGAGRLRMKKD
jgi:hypothetical protein